MFAIAAALALSTMTSAGLVRFTVLPSLTDPEIKTFDSVHTIFFDPGATRRNQLVLFLPGTNGRTGNVDGFCGTAASLGFHVVNLMYPDGVPATVARNDKDPNAFLNFRLEIIEGGDKSPYVEVSRADSIENRLIKLLRYLVKERPAEDWGQFLTVSAGSPTVMELASSGPRPLEPDWSKFVVSGGSQGAGHSALIAIRHKVARAVLFGGPKDFDRARNAPAAWYTKPATPVDRFYTFNHKQDKQGCDYSEQVEICKTIGIAPEADVDRDTRPYHGAHALFTNFPGTPLESVPAHVSVIGDGGSPKLADGTYRFRPVWEYMLTGK